jgi:hypothetical protein
MTLWLPQLKSAVMIGALAVGGCAGPDELAEDKTSWTGMLGSKLKAGLEAIQDASPDLPPLSRVVYDSDRCMIAPEGGVDCKEAAKRICKSRGYSSGRAVDTASINSCRPRSFAQLQSGDGLFCQTKYQVTAALCW